MKVQLLTPGLNNYDRTIQLINKTNQFNCSNLSLNISDIKNLEINKNKFIYLIAL